MRTQLLMRNRRSNMFLIYRTRRSLITHLIKFKQFTPSVSYLAFRVSISLTIVQRGPPRHCWPRIQSRNYPASRKRPDPLRKRNFQRWPRGCQMAQCAPYCIPAGVGVHQGASYKETSLSHFNRPYNIPYHLKTGMRTLYTNFRKSGAPLTTGQAPRTTAYNEDSADSVFSLFVYNEGRRATINQSNYAQK